ncbi:MAG: hypothetical protein OEY34_07330, partial [Cyclobacteriaceae bacterium]|nr:hypothetical protein [Cyclobacteriaceae bacterium]
KKNRALVSASLGAVTGLSPVFLQDQTQKVVSGIGGTTTLTLGTLEAKEVIGASINEINTKQKINTELRNAILSEGSAFARRYNTKASRRNSNFSYDLEKFRNILSSPKFTELELEASWENPKKITNRRLKATYADFDSMDEYEE